MKQKISKIIWSVSKVFLLTLLVVLVIRTFFVESFSVSSAQMETALLRGDKVLVDKTAYGIRMPVTWLAVPFTFDSFLGMKSYSSAVQTGYHRLFAKQVGRNEVVVFNNPLETGKPLDRRNLCISRCVAVPGDTVTVDGYNYLINGKKYVTSPDFLMSFKFRKEISDKVKGVISSLNIPLRNFQSQQDYDYASFNRYEVFLINQNFKDSIQVELAEPEVSRYQIFVPRKGEVIELTGSNIPMYKNIMISELGNRVSFSENSLKIDGKEAKTYSFLFDYYWFLSDNVDDSVDSRYFGFISEKDIIGKASFIWNSSDSAGIRWNRIFTWVKN
ncbi:signal peptidase I [Dysgonomonas sp. 520]|uniref:signal peptidase I n=1 Tax=Dysgonomonas sp. 520 TaxID=2302931 RepID=UPI0013D0BBB5|nr:signal peptidase I [Dysgonomonas sp. 520]NDW10842.1 signal peptidase I [Dysgonomonas sp. 520]